ncbi:MULTISPECIES: TonB-dependent receptor [unclassified Alishewanella]|uniref:TonB-dependent receptor n=1 Tax=unclassified Alishewanella TaxID=2628974 RepID=UPI004042D7FB
MKKNKLRMAMQQILGIAVGLSFMPAIATAQDRVNNQTAEDTIEVITVKGIRRSMETTVDIKKNEIGVVEAVSAEDIGKLPDQSIAESLTRLPGLAGQRVNGRVQVISIRGLAPDFSTTTLNGRQQASAGDNRAVEFDQYPSELINGAVVYKTSDVAIAGMGLSGTVDLRTIRPLAHGEQAIVFNLRGEKSSFDQIHSEISPNGWRGSASYIDQFADNTIGVAIGYAHMDTPTQVKRHKAWEWSTVDQALEGTANDDALGLVGQEVTAVARSQVRDGMMAVFEYRPNDQFHSVLDTYYSKFKQDEIMRSAMWFSNQWTGDGMQFLNPTFDNFGGTKVVKSGVATNLRPVLLSGNNTRDDELKAIGWNTQYKLDRWTLEADLSYSGSEREEQVLEVYAGLIPTGSFDNIGFDIKPLGFPTYTPGIDYADVNKVQLSDPAPWGGWGHDGAIRFPHVKEVVRAAELTGRYDLTDSALGEHFSSFDVGVNYTERNKDKVVDDNDLFLKNGRAPVKVDTSLLLRPTSLAYAGIPGFLAYDIMATVDRYYDTKPILDTNRWNKAWAVEEEVLTSFIRLNLDTQLFGRPLKGNIGTQFVQTDQLSRGFLASDYRPDNPATLVQVEEGASYNDVLPALNLSLEVQDDQFVRLGLGKTMARPRMDEMRANITAGVGVDSRRWSGSSGNPQLEPWRAKAVDLTYEVYLGGSSYVAAGAFFKKLDSYIYTQNFDFDFSNAPNNSNVEPVSPIGNMSRPANGQGGNIRGLELSMSLDMGQFYQPLQGFGFIGSQSWTDSDIKPDGPSSGNKLPGLSDRVRDLTFYYENDGLSARISQRYRSAFRGEVVQLFATRGYTEVLADKQVDAQLSYSFDDGRLAGLTVLFQVNNLTNSPYSTRLSLLQENGGNFPEVYEEYGRQFLFGVSYKL